MPPVNSNTLELPVLADITDDAVWVNNPPGSVEVEDAEVDWKKDGYLKLEIEADLDPFEPMFEAKYSPMSDPPCWLEYNTPDGFIVRVEFEDNEVKENSKGTTVQCTKKEKPKGSIPFPVREDLALDNAIWAGASVTDFEVRWGNKDDEKDHKLEVVIKRDKTCEEEVEDVITHVSLSPKGLEQSTSAQRRALDLLQGVADCNTDFEWQWIQVYALAAFFFSTDGFLWTLSDVGLTSSNACNQSSKFITCAGNDVIGFSPTFNRLVGTITPEIGLLTSLGKHYISSLLYVVLSCN